MKARSTTRLAFAGFTACLLCAGCISSSSNRRDLAKALTFHASFDGRGEAQPGLPTNGVTRLTDGKGRFGNALQFTKKQAPIVFFKAAKNTSYAPSNWNGTVSFWLSTDPATELEPGFCDPIQITSRAWNDAAFFVEFEKRNTIPFRLGAYADLKVWNPANREWNSIPFSEKPLVHVDNPPFARGKWTHVVFTFENFNTGQSNGMATLYLDGEPRGALSPRQQTFTWEQDKAVIALGLNYIGLYDELAVFNRALKAEEVTALYRLENGVGSLLPSK